MSAALPHLSKRVFQENPNEFLIRFTPLRVAMKEYTAAIDPQTFGVYFEYLPSGISISLQAEEPFVAASLLKVPVVMKAYQLKNIGKLSFDEKLTLREEDRDQGFGDLWQREPGTQFTVRELIEAMLKKSDNTALRMVAHRLYAASKWYLDEIFDDLDMPKLVSETNRIFFSPKDYSSIFKSLYFASSLPKRDAEEILSLLAQNAANDKLPAGVPKGTPVAHKIGVYQSKEESIYSDCGIVYAPLRPYLLCMFVRGSEDQATRIMRDLSSIVYRFVTSAEETPQ